MFQIQAITIKLLDTTRRNYNPSRVAMLDDIECQQQRIAEVGFQSIIWW
jgi:hypothetical protein